MTLETFLQGCAGKVTVLVGQAGSGKTLLMSCLGQHWAHGLVSLNFSHHSIDFLNKYFIIIKDVLCKSVELLSGHFEAVGMLENSGKWSFLSDLAKKVKFCSDWAWMWPAGYIAHPTTHLGWD